MAKHRPPQDRTPSDPAADAEREEQIKRLRTLIDRFLTDREKDDILQRLGTASRMPASARTIQKLKELLEAREALAQTLSTHRKAITDDKDAFAREVLAAAVDSSSKRATQREIHDLQERKGKFIDDMEQGKYLPSENLMHAVVRTLESHGRLNAVDKRALRTLYRNARASLEIHR